MTVGQALERAEELRPGCKVDSRTRQRWLCEEDGMLRALLFSSCGLRAGVGADLAWPAEGGLDDAVELLVPVPSNLPRLHARGYDQVWLLCRALGRQLGLPTCRFALRRRWAGRHQTELSAEARWRNAAVQYGRGLRTAPVLGKRVLLVDDVTTTGATASACAAVLLALGAEEVYLCCLTKTLDNAPAPAAWPGANHSL